VNNIKLGVIVNLTEDIEESFREVHELGFMTCQLACTAEFMIGKKLDPTKIRVMAEKHNIEVSSFFLLFEGQIFDRHQGPSTVGFIPRRYRARRLQLAKEFSNIVSRAGVKSITAHVGFIPNDPKEPLYKSFLPVMREFVKHCKKNGQIFCFETGQELPSTLKRAILDLGMDNVGINLDPANLILYGMAHPLDAVEIFGEYVKGVHAKDALWPNRNEPLGIEVPLGEGEVNFPLLIERLREKGFAGPIIIEREIPDGMQRKIDILKAKAFLENIERRRGK